MTEELRLPTFAEAREMCKSRLLEACKENALDGLSEDLLDSPEFKRWFDEDEEVFKEHIRKKIHPKLFLMQTENGQMKVLNILIELAAIDEPVFAELLMELQSKDSLRQEFFDYLELFCALTV